MKKTSAVLIALAVILIVVAASDCAASTVLVTRTTNKGHVYINGGKDAGFVLGAEVCFYSFSGEKITCGTVFRTSATNAAVQVGNREVKKIKQGMQAILDAGEAPEKESR